MVKDFESSPSEEENEIKDRKEDPVTGAILSGEETEEMKESRKNDGWREQK